MRGVVMFKIELGIENTKSNGCKIVFREAVRAVI